MPQANSNSIKLALPKGRPMLTWVGKHPLERVTAFPAQLVERLNPVGDTFSDALNYEMFAVGKQGLLLHGDNKDVLATLLAQGFRGKVRLVYIDPPFDSGADYVRKVTLRGANSSAKLQGDTYSLGEQLQYTDIWANDNYLQFMYERLILLKELLTPDGTIWLHCDPSRGHYLKCIMDEVFGSEHFVNQVVWKRSDAHSDIGQGAKHFGTVHDMLFLYTKGDSYVWNDIFLPLPASTVEKWYRHVEPETGRRYNQADLTGPGGMVKGNPVYEWKGITRAWRFSKERMEELDRQGLIIYTSSGMAYLKRYLDESKGVPLQDWWEDIQMIRGIQRRSEAQYPTEKPEALISRIVQISSNIGDIILDCFAGSGTTAAVAQKMGRRWIAADINKGAIQTTSKRLQTIILMQEQADISSQAQPQLMGAGSEPSSPDSVESPSPAVNGFSLYRVNDYDLQLQHNDAVNLAVEHLGIDRSKADAFFDGLLGERLAKIIPFQHPLTLLDLQLVLDELPNRPGEDRNIVVVCLGKETEVDPWVADHNKRHAVNKIEVVELRTDPRYGKLFVHQPAQAEVEVCRQDGRVVVEIKDFLSPTILERLEMDAGVFRARITDWRAMVDTVLIDTAYDGHVFNVALSDVPKRKSDLVLGRYELPAPSSTTTVAVKVVDMLGEEVLVTAEV